MKIVKAVKGMKKWGGTLKTPEGCQKVKLYPTAGQKYHFSLLMSKGQHNLS
jgi:hypothetical protein